MFTITLDKERHLKFDINAMIIFNTITGKDIVKLFEKIAKDIDKDKLLKPDRKKGFTDIISLDDTRALLYAGLKHEDPDLTLEAAGALIDLHNLKTVITSIITSYAKGNSGEDDPFLPKEPSVDTTSA